MQNKELQNKHEEVIISSDQYYKKVRLVPKKVRLEKDNTLMALNEIDKVIKGDVEAFVVDWYCPNIVGYEPKLSSSWIKVGTYENDIGEQKGDYRTDYLDLKIGNKKLSFILHKGDNFVDQIYGVVKERKSFLNGWKCKRLENISISRKAIDA
jgi:hypothetical protein